MKPIRTLGTNFTYACPVVGGIDLPCQRVMHEQRVISVWQFTDAERQLIARGANLQLDVYGMPPPPVALSITAAQEESQPSMPQPTPIVNRPKMVG